MCEKLVARLTVNLLGPPEVRHGDSPLRFATRKTLALLAFLVAEPGGHARDQLTALLWPESDYERGSGSLRRTVAYLRDSLADRGSQPHLLSVAGRLQVAGELELDLDVLR